MFGSQIALLYLYFIVSQLIEIDNAYLSNFVKSSA